MRRTPPERFTPVGFFSFTQPRLGQCRSPRGCHVGVGVVHPAALLLGPVLRPGVLVKGAVERAGDDILGEHPELDVAVVGAAHEEREGLVVPDAVALHDDSPRRPDVRSRVEGFAELLDLVCVVQQGRRLRREELGDLDSGAVEDSRCTGVQVQARAGRDW